MLILYFAWITWITVSKKQKIGYKIKHIKHISRLWHEQMYPKKCKNTILKTVSDEINKILLLAAISNLSLMS